MLSQRKKLVAAALLLLLSEDLDEDGENAPQTADETDDEEPPPLRHHDQPQKTIGQSKPSSCVPSEEEEIASLVVEVGAPLEKYLPCAEPAIENTNEDEEGPLYIPLPRTNMRRRRRRRRRSLDSPDEGSAGTSDKKKRRFWSQKLYLQRDRLPDNPISEGIPYLDPTEELKILQMSEACFETLLELVSPLIAKRHTAMREAVSPRQRLVAVLRYLVTGQSHETLKFSTLLSPSLMGIVLPETCQAIIQVLSKYMRLPQTKEDWQQVASEFAETCKFPNCGGTLNARHISILKRIGNQGNINYKGYCSIILAVLVDSKHQFMSAEVIMDERESDESAISTTDFYQKLVQDGLGLPDNHETEGGLDFVFTTPNSYPLHSRVLTKYPVQQLNDPSKIIYNDKLRSINNFADNALGLLASRFGILRTSLNIQLWKVDLVVRACCAIHNFLSAVGRSEYISKTTYDHKDEAGSVILGEWRNSSSQSEYSPLQPVCRQSSPETDQNREQYAEYFHSISCCNAN